MICSGYLAVLKLPWPKLQAERKPQSVVEHVASGHRVVARRHNGPSWCGAVNKLIAWSLTLLHLGSGD